MRTCFGIIIHAMGFVAQIGLKTFFPLPQTDLAYGLSDRYAKSRIAVEDGDADLGPSNFIQCILVSTRLLRWYPLQRRHTVRPRYRCAWTASLRAIAPALVGFQGFAFLRGGITAWASLAAIASWHLRVSYAPSAVTLPMS